MNALTSVAAGDIHVRWTPQERTYISSIHSRLESLMSKTVSLRTTNIVAQLPSIVEQDGNEHTIDLGIVESVWEKVIWLAPDRRQDVVDLNKMRETVPFLISYPQVKFLFVLGAGA